MQKIDPANSDLSEQIKYIQCPEALLKRFGVKLLYGYPSYESEFFVIISTQFNAEKSEKLYLRPASIQFFELISFKVLLYTSSLTF